jgi:hypothetical protein
VAMQTFILYFIKEQLLLPAVQSGNNGTRYVSSFMLPEAGGFKNHEHGRSRRVQRSPAVCFASGGRGVTRDSDLYSTLSTDPLLSGVSSLTTVPVRAWSAGEQIMTDIF